MNINNVCHDCGKEISLGADGAIENGQLLKYSLSEGKEKIIFKCNECFEKDKSLRNFQETEVYSRVVGYLRPVSQWNEGKQQEFKDRKEFKLS
ncbi:MAG: anaerobic ribonucleoside-triphosphate reductase [Minisyncoccales bacterium]